MRRVVKLAVLLLAAHALYRFVPVYLHYHQFKDAVEEVALFSRDRGDGEIVDRVMELAERYRVPVDREAVEVRRDRGTVSISLAYDEQIEWVPTYKRPMRFTLGSSQSSTAGEGAR